MNKFKKMSFDQQAEAMQIICNIQTMQDKIHGIHYSFEQFVGNTLDELRRLGPNVFSPVKLITDQAFDSPNIRMKGDILKFQTINCNRFYFNLTNMMDTGSTSITPINIHLESLFDMT